MRDRCTSHLAGRQRLICGGWGKVGGRVQPCEQPGDGNIQGPRQAEQHEHGNIAFPQFDLANIRGSYTHSGGECLMGQTALLPVVPDGHTQKL